MTPLPATAHEPASVAVWDRFVRLCHWSLATGFGANWLNEGGDPPHRWIGYTAVALVLCRVVWGVIGSRHARFSDWVPSPARLRRYLGLLLRGREPRYLGHNPAAAVMMLALLAMLLALGVTGWLTTTDRFFGEEWLEDLHRLLASIMLGMVALHVAAALFESWKHGENLILAMFTGRKRAAGDCIDADTVD